MARKTVATKETVSVTHKKEVAELFRNWMTTHPRANIDEKVEAFDQIADYLYGRSRNHNG